MANNNENINRQSESSNSSSGQFPVYNGAFPIFDFSNPSLSSSLTTCPPISSADEESSNSYTYLNVDSSSQDYAYQSSSELVNDYTIVNPIVSSRKRPLDNLKGSLNGAPDDTEVSSKLKIPVPRKKILDNAASGKGKKRAGGHAPCWAISYGYGFRFKDSKEIVWTYCNYNRSICIQANKTTSYQTGALLKHLSTAHQMNLDLGNYFIYAKKKKKR